MRVIIAFSARPNTKLAVRAKIKAKYKGYTHDEILREVFGLPLDRPIKRPQVEIYAKQ